MIMDPEGWFSDYVRGFYTGIAEDDRNIELKEVHTRCVRENMERLCAAMDLDAENRGLADHIALFHDIGRFEQYRKYRTFSDRKSVNHALLGIRVLARYKVLAGLPDQVRRIVLRAIAFHNAAELPHSSTGIERTLMQLIRDADKLDIWRVVTSYYHREDRSPNKTVELDLPDRAEWNPKILEALMAHRFARLADMRTLNDFKLLQIGWVYDLNFGESFRILKERRYIEAIAETLPDASEIRDAVQEALRYIATRLTLHPALSSLFHQA
jgi:putative nucleotidyltransferase with HDIG domain